MAETPKTPAEYLRRLVEAEPDLLKRGGVFRRAGVHESADWLRIVSMPYRTLALDSIPDLTPLWATRHGTMRLWPVQSAALLEAEAVNGAFLAMPVGTGKSLTAALMPDALKSRLTVVLVPPALKRRTLEQVYPALSEHFTLPLARLRVVSYTELERAPGDVLERLRPDLIIADEAHLLKHKAAARTARFLRYFRESPDTRLVVMSGTLTLKSILDYAHLLKLALAHRSPLPNVYTTLCEWAEALDVGDDPRPPGALLRLCNEVKHVHSDVRDYYGCRFTGSRGVIAYGAGFTGVPLVIARRSLAVPERITNALEKLRKTWTLPEAVQDEDAAEVDEAPDEAVSDDLAYARFCRQLACGFYLRWAWPDGVRDREWLERRRRWAATVRHILRYSRKPGLDSPLLVANAAIRGELGKDHLEAWAAWAEVKGRRKPETVPIWIDRYLIQEACDWVREAGDGAIVWYEYIACGEEIAKALNRPLELGMTFDGAPLVLSMKRYGTGVDGLQTLYRRALYTSVPNAKLMEQTLGRIHRPGQTRTVNADMLIPAPEAMERFNKSKREADYMQSTGFGKQKLLSATLTGFEE